MKMKRSKSTLPCQINTIEAWRDECGWYWNNSFRVTERKIPEDVFFSNRKLLAYLRDEIDLLSEGSKGRMRVDRSADSIVEIQMKGTYEPIVAVLLLREN